MPKEDPMDQDTLSAVFGALADPTRRSILERLGRGDATVTQLAEPFAISLPAVSRHLKVLEQAGLITRVREAQTRVSTLRAQPLDEVEEWLDRIRALWGVRFDLLDAHLRRVTSQTRSAQNTARKDENHG
jgi:DNA-binding transcriptional ArsR family regulator